MSGCWAWIASAQRVLTLLGIDELLALDTQLAQRNAAEVGELQLALDLDFGVQLPLQLALIVVLEAGRMRDVVEHGLHGSRLEGDSGIECRDEIALGVADWAEARIALETRIELVGLVQILMHTVQRLVGWQRPRSDMKLGGWHGSRRAVAACRR